MCAARSPYPDPQSPVRDAFLGLPLPDGVLPDTDPTIGVGSHTRQFTDTATTCPDDLVEEVLWGLLHGLTAPVTGGSSDPTESSEVQHD